MEEEGVRGKVGLLLCALLCPSRDGFFDRRPKLPMSDAFVPERPNCNPDYKGNKRGFFQEKWTKYPETKWYFCEFSNTVLPKRTQKNCVIEVNSSWLPFSVRLNKIIVRVALADSSFFKWFD